MPSAGTLMHHTIGWWDVKLNTAYKGCSEYRIGKLHLQFTISLMCASLSCSTSVWQFSAIVLASAIACIRAQKDSITSSAMYTMDAHSYSRLCICVHDATACGTVCIDIHMTVLHTCTPSTLPNAHYCKAMTLTLAPSPAWHAF